MIDSSNPDTSPAEANLSETTPTEGAASPAPSFVKLAMRNMVRKGRQSLLHFGLTAVGFSAVLLLLAWFGRPSLPQ